MILEEYCKKRPADFEDLSALFVKKENGTKRSAPTKGSLINIQTNQDVHKMLMESIPEISQSNSFNNPDLSNTNSKTNSISLDNSKEHMKALLKYITDSSRDEEDKVKTVDHEAENTKAMGILKGCTQMKQIKVAFDVLYQLRKDKIKISREVYDEVLKCCLACSDINKASEVIKLMNKNGVFPDPDLIDKFLELYNTRSELDYSVYNQSEAENSRVSSLAEDPGVLDKGPAYWYEFEPKVESNVWLDKNLDLYLERHKEDRSLISSDEEDACDNDKTKKEHDNQKNTYNNNSNKNKNKSKSNFDHDKSKWNQNASSEEGTTKNQQINAVRNILSNKNETKFENSSNQYSNVNVNLNPNTNNVPNIPNVPNNVNSSKYNSYQEPSGKQVYNKPYSTGYYGKPHDYNNRNVYSNKDKEKDINPSFGTKNSYSTQDHPNYKADFRKKNVDTTYKDKEQYSKPTSSQSGLDSKKRDGVEVQDSQPLSYNLNRGSASGYAYNTRGAYKDYRDKRYNSKKYY